MPALVLLEKGGLPRRRSPSNTRIPPRKFENRDRDGLLNVIAAFLRHFCRDGLDPDQ
jgi:hypothetical protein